MADYKDIPTKNMLVAHSDAGPNDEYTVRTVFHILGAASVKGVFETFCFTYQDGKTKSLGNTILSCSLEEAQVRHRDLVALLAQPGYGFRLEAQDDA